MPVDIPETDETVLRVRVYKLLTSAVIPRPIAFVSTISEDGVRNLAPMRCVPWSQRMMIMMVTSLAQTVISIWYVEPALLISIRAQSCNPHFQVSHNPPLLSVSLSLSKRRPKDTRENIKATKEFTVSIISEPFVEAANVCSVEAPAHVDEWVVSGLTPEPSVRSLNYVLEVTD